MTSLDKIEHGPVAAATSGNHLALELTETLKLAVPMALAHTVFFVCFTFPDVGCGPACRASVRRPQPAPGSALASRRAMGGLADLAADDGVSAVRRADPCHARPGAR